MNIGFKLSCTHLAFHLVARKPALRDTTMVS